MAKITKKLLARYREEFEQNREHAQSIMDGGENYDGADGARYMLDVTDAGLKLVEHVLEMNQDIPED